MAGTATNRSIAQNLVDSDEFLMNYGEIGPGPNGGRTLSDAAFVTVMMLNALNRIASDETTQGWTALLGAGQLSRADLLGGFAESIDHLGVNRNMIVSEVSYTLPDTIANLTLIGASLIDGMGNGLDNIIMGNSAANNITGLAGNDTLYGGSGNDALAGGDGNDILMGGPGADGLLGGNGSDQFNFASPADGGDFIFDFSFGTDLLTLSRTGFGLAAAGSLQAAGVSFVYGTSALSAGPTILVDGDNIYWDADGTGSGSPVLLANTSASSLG